MSGFIKDSEDSGLGGLGTRRTRDSEDSEDSGLGGLGTRKLSHIGFFKPIFFHKISIVQIYYSTNVLLKSVQGDTKIV